MDSFGAKYLASAEELKIRIFALYSFATDEMLSAYCAAVKLDIDCPLNLITFSTPYFPRVSSSSRLNVTAINSKFILSAIARPYEASS